MRVVHVRVSQVDFAEILAAMRGRPEAGTMARYDPAPAKRAPEWRSAYHSANRSHHRRAFSSALRRSDLAPCGFLGWQPGGGRWTILPTAISASTALRKRMNS
jgi:hypothetical protein